MTACHACLDFWLNFCETLLKYFNSAKASISKTDFNKAIEYGKLQLKNLEKNNAAYALQLRISFLSELRIPYRNSKRINEGFSFYTEKFREYKSMNDSAGIATCYYVLGGFYHAIGLMDQSIYNFKKSISFLDSSYYNNKDKFNLRNYLGRNQWINNTAVLGEFYLEALNYYESLKYSYIAFNELCKNGGPDLNINTTSYCAGNIAQAKLILNQYDSLPYFLEIGRAHV